MSISVAGFAPILGYDEMGETVAEFAAFASSIAQYIISELGLVVAVLLLLPVFYMMMGLLTKCADCGESFAALHYTKYHHDREYYSEKLEKVITPTDLVLKCRNCDPVEHAEQHEHSHAHQTSD